MPVTFLTDDVLSPKIFDVCLRLKKAGAQPILVGGWVRDRLMRLPPEETRDVDIEVFRITFEDLLQLFPKKSRVSFPKFGVLRLDYVDISLPRIEHCTGSKYNDFYVQIDPYLSFEKAGKRRDFTINAIGLDPFSKKILDPFCGLKDLREKILRPITTAFMEDGYRILRAAQLIARFNFTPDRKLLEFGRQMAYKKLSQKHIQNTKLILNSTLHTEKALEFLKNIQWFPIVDVM